MACCNDDNDDDDDDDDYNNDVDVANNKIEILSLSFRSPSS